MVINAKKKINQGREVGSAVWQLQLHLGDILTKIQRRWLSPLPLADPNMFSLCTARGNLSKPPDGVPPLSDTLQWFPLFSGWAQHSCHPDPRPASIPGSSLVSQTGVQMDTPHPMSKYWKLIHQANKLLNTLCPLPWQTYLHCDRGADFIYRFVGLLWVPCQNLAAQGAQCPGHALPPFPAIAAQLCLPLWCGGTSRMPVDCPVHIIVFQPHPCT